MNASTSSTIDQERSEGFWPHDVVTPSRRSTDASRLTFPIQMVIAILSLLGGVWLITQNIKNDIGSVNSKVDLIQQRLDDNVKLDEMKAKLDESNRRLQERDLQAMRDAINAMQQQEKLNTIEIGNVRLDMQKGTRR